MPNERATNYDGDLVEEIVDNGDGTGLRISYEGGEVVDTEAIELPALVVEEPTNEERVLAYLTSLPPGQAGKAIALGSLMVDRAGELWDALVEVAPTNTAKPLLDKIVDTALTVALGLEG